MTCSLPALLRHFNSRISEVSNALIMIGIGVQIIAAPEVSDYRALDLLSGIVSADSIATLFIVVDSILPAVREAAKFNGYAVAVHGSLKRDIDLIAVAWTDQAKPVGDLVRAIQGAVGGILGSVARTKSPMDGFPIPWFVPVLPARST